VSHFLSPLVSTPDQAWSVRNLTSGRVVVSRLEAAFDSATRKKGLLGRDRLEPGEGLVIAPCGGIHTCFMRFPIDVVFVARDGRVVKVRADVKPWRLAIALSVDLRHRTARQHGGLHGNTRRRSPRADPLSSLRVIPYQCPSQRLGNK